MNLLPIYQSAQTVFDLKDLAFLLGEDNYNNLKSKVAYYVRQGYLIRIRKGIFVKPTFNHRELACKIYTPSYVSFETILSDHNIIFQYDSTIYLASYLSRSISIPYNGSVIHIHYRKLKDDILYDPQGITYDNYISCATASRAISDMRYLKPDFYFDNLPNDGL